MKRVELAKDAYDFLEDLKNDIQEYKEAGYIGYYGFYEDEHKRENGIFTNDFLDLFQYASLNSHILVCDDRWANSYNNFNDCLIYSVADIVELLHEQRIISDEKYINVITQKKATDRTYSRIMSGRQVANDREAFGFEVRL